MNDSFLTDEPDRSSRLPGIGCAILLVLLALLALLLVYEQTKGDQQSPPQVDEPTAPRSDEERALMAELSEAQAELRERRRQRMLDTQPEMQATWRALISESQQRVDEITGRLDAARKRGK